MPENVMVLGVVALIIVAFVVLPLLVDRSGFVAKPLLTDNEIEFFGRLKRALPNYEIFPQVALRAFITPRASRNSKQFWSELGKIGSKHCDFLVCRQGKYEVVAIIELDDRMHDAKSDKVRDAMTAKAGYATLRFQSKNRPSVGEIRDAVAKIDEQARQART